MRMIFLPNACNVMSHYRYSCIPCNLSIFHHVNLSSLQDFCILVFIKSKNLLYIPMPSFFFVQSVSLLSEVPCLKDTCHERALRFADFNCFRWSLAFSATPRMSLNFFSGNETGSGSENSGGRPRTWTNNLICANVLVYAAQYVSQGKITNWGAKINCGIRKGQLWRLVTCAFLHANIGHLLLNCYSLDSVGPTIEKIWGPERYLTIYISSAIAGSTMSYLLNKSHSVGASGAICGLVISRPLKMQHFLPKF
ncbi:hypothetical protein ACS0TY_011503 [Phlomoides rotata]